MVVFVVNYLLFGFLGAVGGGFCCFFLLSSLGPEAFYLP